MSTHPTPPKWADRFLQAFCREDVLEQLQGDLHELFYTRNKGNPAYARLMFVLEVIGALRFLQIKPVHNPLNMYILRNYLLTAMRNLARHRTYTLANILGLSIGIASIIVIMLFVKFELSFDEFHEDHVRVVRVSEYAENDNGERVDYATGFYPLATALTDEIPSVQMACRVFSLATASWIGAMQVERTKNTDKFIEPNFFLVDSTFFDVFTFPITSGADRPLDEPFSLVITERMARKYFGDADPVGSELSARDNKSVFPFKVTAVCQDPPANSHFEFDFLASMSSKEGMMRWIDNWHHPEMHIYARIHRESSVADMRDQIADLPARVLPANEAAGRDFVVTPIADIHLKSHRENELGRNGSMQTVYVFTAAGILILIIACINFMNLATANSARRGKEIGVRKALGALRSQLIQQFLSESFLITALSFAIALLGVRLVLPQVSTIVDRPLVADYWQDPGKFWVLLVIFIGIGLLAGLYPAFYLTGKQVMASIQGSQPGVAKGGTVRKGLVITQFAISSVLLVATLVIYQQIRYMNNKSLGFNTKQIINVPLRDTDKQIGYSALKDRLMQHPNILGIAASSGVPTTDGLHEFMVKPKNGAFDSLSMLTLTVDEDFAEVYGLEFVAGRDFSADHPSDAHEAVVINESAARTLGWVEGLNQELQLTYYYRGDQTKRARVIGVVRDFNYHSLHKPVLPMVMHQIPNSYYHDYVSLKVQSTNVPEILSFVESQWNEFSPTRPFEYSFLDQTFAALYVEESRLNKMFTTLSLIAIFIACLGLFALASFTISRRTREISIRKIMGASVNDILLMLSAQFTRLVVLAFVLSIPISIYFAGLWLQSYAYRINLTVGLFLLAGALVIFIAILTVSFHAWRAAVLNPAKTLKHE